MLVAGTIEEALTNPGISEAAVAAVIAVVGALAAFWSRRANRNAEQANKAVNGNPSTEPRLYERIVAMQDEQANARDERGKMAASIDRLLEGQQDFQRRWGNLPPDMDDAVDLVSMFDRITQRLERMEEGRVAHGRRLDRVEAELHKVTDLLRGRRWR